MSGVLAPGDTMPVLFAHTKPVQRQQQQSTGATAAEATTSGGVGTLVSKLLWGSSAAAGAGAGSSQVAITAAILNQDVAAKQASYLEVSVRQWPTASLGMAALSVVSLFVPCSL